MIFPGGVQGKQYGLLTAVIHRGAFSMTPSEPRSRGKDTAATARQSAGIALPADCQRDHPLDRSGPIPKLRFKGLRGRQTGVHSPASSAANIHPVPGQSPVDPFRS